MKFCTCANCDFVFEFVDAKKDVNSWYAICPECGSINNVDIEDYLVPQGTTVELETGEKGIVYLYSDQCAATFEGIIYFVKYNIDSQEYVVPCKRSGFKVLWTWKKLRHNGEYLERICHYPRNQYGNVPCYGCADRAKWNDDIFNQLWEYEKTDLPPSVVAEYKKFEDELVASGLTFNDVLKLIDRHMRSRLGNLEG